MRDIRSFAKKLKGPFQLVNYDRPDETPLTFMALMAADNERNRVKRGRLSSLELFREGREMNAQLGR